MSKDDEIRVRNFLQRSGLIPIRYNKEELRTLGKTPDFKVESEGKEVLFCEVKSIVGDDFEGVRDDPTYNNIQNKIHEAAKQFQSVNSSHIVPNVLAIVNHEYGIDIIDLYSVLTGYFYTDKGGEYPLFMKYSQGRILNEKQEIDLYIWFQEDKNPYYCFNTDSMFSLMLYGLFNIQPDKAELLE
jgi:hypothetical protein